VAETAKRWGQAEPYVNRHCATGRVKGTMRVPTFEAFGRAQPALRFVWLIPADARKPHTYYTRLTEAQREEIARRARRARDGEGRTVLAREYGVTHAYVHRLMNRLA
jgi:hypothetical protein